MSGRKHTKVGRRFLVASEKHSPAVVLGCFLESLILVPLLHPVGWGVVVSLKDPNSQLVERIHEMEGNRGGGVLDIDQTAQNRWVNRVQVETQLIVRHP